MDTQIYTFYRTTHIITIDCISVIVFPIIFRLNNNTVKKHFISKVLVCHLNTKYNNSTKRMSKKLNGFQNLIAIT
jgi:hypothetical protein